MPRIKFSPENAVSQTTIAVSFDLSGFSEFCNRRDSRVVLPKSLASQGLDYRALKRSPTTSVDTGPCKAFE